jgi:predicted SprT family Zn-dependent metalloprotease/ribosomal protein S27E
VEASPTQEIYGALERAADYFNRELFDGVLTPCVITVQRGKKYIGYFAASRWENRDGRRTHEIAMNPTAMAERTLLDVLSTLAHELAHQWQFEHGVMPRAGYHDKHFAAIMEGIGLITSSTASPGGARIGQRMSHYIVEGGRFHEAARALAAKEFFMPWIEWGAVRIVPPRIYDRSGRPYEPLVESVSSPVAGGKRGPGEPPEDDEEEEHPSSPAVGGNRGPGEPPEDEDEDETETAPAGPDDILNRPLTRLAAPAQPQEPGTIQSPPKAPKSSKTKYSCPECNANIWGKPNLDVVCGPCGVSFVDTTG